MDEFYSILDNEQKVMFKELEVCLQALGYKPSRAKTKDVNIVFKNSKTKEHIAKFSIEKGKPVLKMKYYSSSNYSFTFNEAIRLTIEEYQYKYTGCYKCGKCKEELEGYTYRYTDGRMYFRCGKELIAIPLLKKENIEEVKQLLCDHHLYLNNKQSVFKFMNFDLLTDGVIDLVIEAKVPGNPEKGYVPAYKYKVCMHNSIERIGEIDIRIGSNKNTYYGGNIGYSIDETFRGNGYASKACQLIKQVGLGHGMEQLIITCNPDNWPSRRTCEKIGIQLKEIVDLPEDNDMFLEGEKQKCVYEWKINL